VGRIDSFFIHAITLDYSKLYIEAYDVMFNHWMLGIVLLIVGLLGLGITSWRWFRRG